MTVVPKRRVMIQRIIFPTVAIAILVTGVICINAAQASVIKTLDSSVGSKQHEMEIIMQANPERVALIAAVNAQITASGGKVLDPAIIATAKTQTAKSSAIVLGAAKAIIRAKSNISALVAASKNSLPETIIKNAASIHSIRIKPTANVLEASDAELKVTIESLETGEHDWAVEQTRIAAVRKVAEEKAAEVAAIAAQEAARVEATRSSPRAVVSSSQALTPTVLTGGGSNMDIAQGVFARFGFSSVDYNSPRVVGHYGATDLDHQIIYMNLAAIPTDRVASACIHEYMHILQARQYGGYAATVAHFGSVLGMEQAADQAAIANGATWTRYI